MARIENSTYTKTVNGQAYCENRIHKINNDSQIVDLDDIKLTPAYKDGLPAEMRTAMDECEKMLRWVMKQNNMIGIAAVAYSDSQVDAIDPDIRTHEE